MSDSPAKYSALCMVCGLASEVVKGKFVSHDKKDNSKCEGSGYTPNDAGYLRVRPGDQPLPKKNNNPVIHTLVQEDLQARLEVGIKRYGSPLQAFNGRNALRDAYEEVLDLAVYLRQAIYEQENNE